MSAKTVKNGTTNGIFFIFFIYQRYIYFNVCANFLSFFWLVIAQIICQNFFNLNMKMIENLKMPLRWPNDFFFNENYSWVGK